MTWERPMLYTLRGPPGSARGEDHRHSSGDHADNSANPDSSAMLDAITPDNVSQDILREVFDAAMMDVSLDSDGDIKVREDVNCFVFLSESKTTIQLFCQFAWEKRVKEAKRLECVNEINRKYLIIKATSRPNGALGFEHDIPLKAGISPKYLVQAVKRFCAIPREAIQSEASGLVE